MGYLQLTITLDTSRKLMLDTNKGEGVLKLAPSGSDSTELSYTFSIDDLQYRKKMYQPGEVTVLTHVTVGMQATGDQNTNTSTGWKPISKDKLMTEFLNKEAKLVYIDDNKKEKNICKGYFVHELIPVYRPDGMDLTFKIFSPDKVLTLKDYCRTFVAKRLAKDILSGQLKYFKLPYDKAHSMDVDTKNMKTLLDGSNEAIFPYLVQYNESFYDFLVRTTNRWGEFMYFEDGKFHIGHDTKATAVKKYETLQYLNLNPKKLETAFYELTEDEATYAPHLLKNILKKSGYDAVTGQFLCDLDHGLDVWAFKQAGDALSGGKTIYDFVKGIAVDGGISRGQAELKTKEKNDKFNEKYFDSAKIEAANTSSNGRVDRQYDNAKSSYNQFAEIEPFLTGSRYQKILKGEIVAGQDAIEVNFDTDYQDFHLGQVITIDSDSTKYIIVECSSQSVCQQVVVNSVVVPGEKKQVFHITATAENSADSRFYPTVHPAGHVKHSDPQLATVTDVDDPTRQLRVRVKYDWQKRLDDDKAKATEEWNKKSAAEKANLPSPDDKWKDAYAEEDSPWMVFAHPGGNKGIGTYHQHYKTERVMVDFADGNVERPYVMGALATDGQTVPKSAYTNKIVHVTPGGQKIAMGDGAGKGLTAMLKGMQPGLKTMLNFFPSADLFKWAYTEKEKVQDINFEGAIEMGDKYGFWNIKGSTDERKISIKSPWGDVSINAFTGITISAPNGNVSIKGKNVSIEAGNNLTITSGKNITDTWYASNGSVKSALAATVGKTLGGYIDISLFRHLWEVLIRPVEGQMKLKSNRFLMMEAGGGKTAYPLTAYGTAAKAPGRDKVNLLNPQTVQDEIAKIPGIAAAVCSDFASRYTMAKGAYGTLVDTITSKTVDGKLPTKPAETLLSNLWSQDINEITNDFCGFDGILKLPENDDELTTAQKNLYDGFDEVEYAATEAYRIVVNMRVRRIIIDYQTRIKKSLTKLNAHIKKIKNFKLKPFVKEHTQNATMRENLTDALLAGHFIKTALNDENFKKLTLNLMSAHAMDNYAKQLRRKMFIKMIDAFGFNREAVKMGPLAGIAAGTPPAAPDPYSANFDEEKWNAYVYSIRKMPPKPKEDKTFMQDVKATALKTAGFTDWAGADDKAFGSNQKGQILFSTSSDTMVLADEIYRANVDYSEDVVFAEGENPQRGFAAAVRQVMLQ